MVLLILLTYFIIGFVVGLFIYDYYCKDFNKKNNNRWNNEQCKLTWEEYSSREGPGLSIIIAIFLWPVLLLIIICYYMFQYPINCIKKRNGIK